MTAATVRLTEYGAEHPLAPDEVFYLDRETLDRNSDMISRRPNCLQLKHVDGDWVLMNRSLSRRAWVKVPNGTRDELPLSGGRVLPPGRSEVFLNGHAGSIVITIPQRPVPTTTRASTPTMPDPYLAPPRPLVTQAINNVVRNPLRRQILAVRFGGWFVGGTDEPRLLSAEQTARCASVSVTYVNQTQSDLRQAMAGIWTDSTPPGWIARWLVTHHFIGTEDLNAVKHANCSGDHGEDAIPPARTADRG